MSRCSSFGYNSCPPVTKTLIISCGGNFEQHFFHCGKPAGDRVLLELRSTPGGWYLEAFVRVKDSGTTLIEPTLLHTHNQWYHITFINKNGKLETWINGIKELEDFAISAPLNDGITSIGVRQNKVFWFKGVIYKVRVTPKASDPEKFMKM